MTVYGTLTSCSVSGWKRWLKTGQFSCLASVPHLKPPTLNLACGCATYFTYGEDGDLANFNLGYSTTACWEVDQYFKIDTLGMAQGLISDLVNL